MRQGNKFFETKKGKNMIEEFKLFKNAYKTYNLDKREDISKDVLKYIRERLLSNKDLFEQLILITEEDVTFEEILHTFDEEVKKESDYKKEKRMKLNEYGFVSGIYSTSVGIIAVETASPLLIIKYFVSAIKSRNAIIISDMEFAEESIKSAFWIIFAEALKKFNIDSNIINIVPFEECNYELFDKIILTEENIIRDVKRFSNEVFIYIEDAFFEEEVQKEVDYLREAGKNPIVIRNNFEDTIEKINKNKAYASCIYTKNPKLGYNFINLVKTNNAFINSSIRSYGEDITEHENPLYMKKKIMFELGSIKGENTQIDNLSDDEQKNTFHNNVNNIVNIKVQEDFWKDSNTDELSLIKIDTTPWYKRIFNKFMELKKRILGESSEK